MLVETCLHLTCCKWKSDGLSKGFHSTFHFSGFDSFIPLFICLQIQNLINLLIISFNVQHTVENLNVLYHICHLDYLQLFNVILRWMLVVILFY